MYIHIWPSICPWYIYLWLFMCEFNCLFDVWLFFHPERATWRSVWWTTILALAWMPRSPWSSTTSERSIQRNAGETHFRYARASLSHKQLLFSFSHPSANDCSFFFFFFNQWKLIHCLHLYLQSLSWDLSPSSQVSDFQWANVHIHTYIQHM